MSPRRFLADENSPLPSVRLLRRAGYDVASIIADAPGTADVDIMARAVAEGRVLLTFDRDYGEIAYRLQQPTPSGMVSFRSQARRPEEPGERLLQLLSAPNITLEGRLTVVAEVRLRQRPLP